MVDGKDYRYRDPDYHRHYYEANKEKISEYTKKWNKAHPRKYVYKKKNPEQKRVQYNRRRSRKNRVPFNFTVADQRRALNYFHGYCPVCQKPLRDLFGDHHPQLDHWIPLADSRPDNPGTVPWNMVPLCNRCNSSKQGSDPLIWLESKFGKHKARLISERIERFFEWTKRKDGEAKAAR
jgi:5-methylcytosine-specific restriction endonuclease McrA